LDPNELPAFQRLKKSAYVVNELVKDHFMTNYGLNVDYENLEQVYNPTVTGIHTLANTRDYLIERGMSDYWADKLMH
jgi:hypothetical protein